MVGLLSVEGVGKGYLRGTHWAPVFADASLEVMPGEIVAITGSRLEGKTTLLKIAAGIERPDTGTVSLGDRRLTDCDDAQRSRLLGREIVWVDRDGPGLDVEVSKFVGWPLALHGRGRQQAEKHDGVQIARSPRNADGDNGFISDDASAAASAAQAGTTRAAPSNRPANQATVRENIVHSPFWQVI